jgi:hypothetical protein
MAKGGILGVERICWNKKLIRLHFNPLNATRQLIIRILNNRKPLMGISGHSIGLIRQSNHIAEKNDRLYSYLILEVY